MASQDFEHEYTLRAPRYAVIQSGQECWDCGQDTSVVGLLIPAEHEQLWIDDDPASDEWEKPDSASLVSHVSRLLPTVLAELQAASPHYRFGTTKSAGQYFMNFCAHCQAAQGDFFLYSEPDGAFFFMSEDEVHGVRIRRVDAPFACHGDSSYSSLIDHLAQKVWPAQI